MSAMAVFGGGAGVPGVGANVQSVTAANNHRQLSLASLRGRLIEYQLRLG